MAEATMKLWTVHNARNTHLFLGRSGNGKSGLREVPVLFSHPTHAFTFIDENAQVANDWQVVGVTITTAEDLVARPTGKEP